MNPRVIFAIFKRNFAAYFSTPTGYVFICVFVLLSSFAAFWPAEFFSNNLANLDQLNRYLPFILLVFIPAITMSTWAEEKRQGTDELLLTIPAADLDVVVGKFLSAIAIYTVALLFSLFCNFIVLSKLGNPDLGLFIGTYLGYFFVGVAMVAIGMIASFLTGNLTVAFILGALFNAPLAFLAYADAIMDPGAAMSVKQWSFAEQFRDFSRGVVSLSSISYFVMLVVAMLYLSIVLIGRRHWQGSRQSQYMGLHYLARTVALLLIAVSVVMLFTRFDVRADMTTERLSSLSPNTKEIISKLDSRYPVRVEAFISPQVPETFAQTRLNLLNALREVKSLAGTKLQIDIYDTEPLSEASQRAEDQYGIVARDIQARERGALKVEQIHMGLAITSGLKKVVVPFVDRGTPVEYELVRSIVTVSEEDQKRIGVLATDAQLMPGFNPQTFTPTPKELLIEELEKQYEVVQVRADQPITEKFDVLLAVQPSSLGPEQMVNFMAAVRNGQPTAIFEDPFPWLSATPATSAPRRSPQQNPFMMGGGGPPKGDIRPLWRFLGIDFPANKIVWQDYNPNKELQDAFPMEFIFVDKDLPNTDQPFNASDEITSNLQQLLLVMPGHIIRQNDSDFRFDALLKTGPFSGETNYEDASTQPIGALPHSNATGINYILAAHITGDIKGPPPPEDEEPAPKPEGEATKKLNVVLVADIDFYYREFFQLRDQQGNPEIDFILNLDNVTFALNVIDSLAGEHRFMEIRKRRPKHRALVEVETRTETARREAAQKRKEAQQAVEQAQAQEQEALNKRLEELEARTDMDQRQKIQELALAQQVGQRRLQVAVRNVENKMRAENRKTDQKLETEIRKVQDTFKMWAVLAPPIPPLLVALAVFFNRRSKEKEGVARSRLRQK